MIHIKEQDGNLPSSPIREVVKKGRVTNFTPTPLPGRPITSVEDIYDLVTLFSPGLGTMIDRWYSRDQPNTDLTMYSVNFLESRPIR